MNEGTRTAVYTAFDTLYDIGFARISGSGLGNCFYTYFHAVVLAQQFGGTVIAPPWLNIKLGPLLRGESSKRLYWRMFKPFPGEIYGFDKLVTLVRGYRRRAIVDIGGPVPPALVRGRLNIVTSSKWTFEGLQPYRDMIRQRLMGIVNDPAPPDHSWGQGQFIAVHVRLSDFVTAADPTLVVTRGGNTRIPLSWYVTVAGALRRRYPDMPMFVFSDGKAEELQPLLAVGARLYRSGSDMTDLLAMSSASILVGSNSTYSRWAAFLGDMPSIWLSGAHIDKDMASDGVTAEKFSGPDTPVCYVAIDATEVSLWP
jgi:hypothetical protein